MVVIKHSHLHCKNFLTQTERYFSLTEVTCRCVMQALLLLQVMCGQHLSAQSLLALQTGIICRLCSPLMARDYQLTASLTSTCPKSEVKVQSASLQVTCDQQVKSPSLRCLSKPGLQLVCKFKSGSCGPFGRCFTHVRCSLKG